jgi:ABC-type multidrug transport system ATPase subunit
MNTTPPMRLALSRAEGIVNGNATPSIVIDSLSDTVTDNFVLTIPALRVAPGKRTALIGPNGSGKSTLFAHLLGERTASHGTVQVLDHEAGQLPVADRQRIGVQLQEGGYNERYIVRDICTLHKRAYSISRDDVFQALDLANLAKRRFGTLSSGEKQRVQLAMAIAHAPDLLLLDEPTSNLDPHFRHAFCSLLADCARANPAFACLVITHAREVVAACDEIVVLRAGSIDQYGPKDLVVRRHFGPYGCAFTGCEAVRSRAELALARAGSIQRVMTRGDTLTVFGGEWLHSTATALANALPVERFSVWKTDAFDLLESIDHA